MARILIVDDDPTLLQMVKIMVEREGHQAILAEDGLEGEKLAKSHIPDLVILDVMMPKMSGYDVVKALRADPRTSKIPILILTARAQPMDEQMAIEVGADSYLAKPVTSRELIEKVDKLLSSAAPLPFVKGEGLLPLVTVLGLRGGVGATTVAVNLALALMAHKHRVCLVDLAANCGHVALQFRMTPTATWADLTDVPDDSAVDGVLTSHPSGLSILAAPPIPSTKPPPPHVIDRALALIAGKFDRIVVDAPELNDAVAATLEKSSSVIIVLGDDLASVQTTGGLLRELKGMGVNMDRVKLVLNHVRADKIIPPASIQKALGRHLDVELPYDPAQSVAVGRGTPLIMSQPRSPFVQGILYLSRML